MEAASLGRLDCLKELLDHGAALDRADNDGWTALMHAAMEGHRDCLKELLDHGAAVDLANNGGWTPLISAASNGHLDCLKELLDRGAAVDLADNDGWTALMIAAYKGHLDCLQALLDRGAAVDLAGNSGWTAMMTAAYESHLDCLKELLARGAAIDHTSNAGMTALMNTAYEGHLDCLQGLLDWGAAIDLANNAGKTALMRAAYEGHLDCLQALLDRGAAVDIADNSGKTAIALAIEIGHTECAITIERAIQDNEEVQRNRLHEAPLETTSSSVLPSPLAPPAPQEISPPNIQALHLGPAMIPFASLDIQERLGAGSYATVYLARWGGTTVAVKKFHEQHSSLAAIDGSDSLSKIHAERDLLASIRHPNVLTFYGMCEYPDPLAVVTEICSHGSLFDLLEKSNDDLTLAADLTWERRLRFAIDAAAGMAHLHERSPPVLHRDLKSPNLLIDAAWRVKVGDLGLARFMDELNAQTAAGSTASHMNPRWLAGDVLSTGKWLPSSDVYSFGVVLWELMSWQVEPLEPCA